MEKSTTAESPFSKFIHVGLIVRDMDKAIERLSSLGIGPFEAKSPPPGREERVRGKVLDAKLKAMGTKIGGVELELIQPGDVESPHKEFLDSKGEGIQHIACAVEDLDREVARLTDQGASVLFSATWQGGSIAYVDLDVGGLIIELVQRK